MQLAFTAATHLFTKINGKNSIKLFFCPVHPDSRNNAVLF